MLDKKNTCVIMQPTYLPWAGYFNLINSADKFVFLDDVQFEKSCWQSRNRILQNGNMVWLSLPVAKHSLNSTIKDIRLSEGNNWQKKHLKSIRQSYAKARHLDVVLNLLTPIINNKSKFLIDYTQNIIVALSNCLNLNTTFINASDMSVKGNRSERLVNICNQLNVTEYLSPMGSKQYLEEDGVLSNHSNIKLNYQYFQVKPYQQINSLEFVSHLSIIDMLAIHGVEETKLYISEN